MRTPALPAPYSTPFHPTSTPCHPTSTPGLKQDHPMSPHSVSGFGVLFPTPEFREPYKATATPNPNNVLYHLFAFISSIRNQE
jgi:hypothetical protein